jgi:hypothetical protein
MNSEKYKQTHNDDEEVQSTDWRTKGGKHINTKARNKSCSIKMLIA